MAKKAAKAKAPSTRAASPKDRQAPGRAAAPRAKSTRAGSPKTAASSDRARAGAAAPGSKASRARGGRGAGARKGTTASKTATRPKAAKPKALDAEFLAEQRELLLAERATYVEQAEDLKAEAESLVQEMEPGDVQFDEESGEGGTVTVDRERDLALSAQALAAVEEIDRALAKIGDGTYGVCERCGAAIPKARLRALPYASLCIACKSGGLSRR